MSDIAFSTGSLTDVGGIRNAFRSLRRSPFIVGGSIDASRLMSNTVATPRFNDNDEVAYDGPQDDSHEESMVELVGVSFVADEPSILGGIDYDYISRELQWYDSQSLDVNNMPGPVPPIWKSIANKRGRVNSNYGRLLHGETNCEQYGNVLNALLGDKNSRRAIAIYTRPSIHREVRGVTQDDNDSDDFICTNTVQYLIRGNELITVVNMRSNDAVFGYRNDFAWQDVARTRLLKDLQQYYSDLKMGQMIWQAGSLHIYPRHLSLLDRAIDSGNWYRSMNAKR